MTNNDELAMNLKQTAQLVHDNEQISNYGKLEAWKVRFRHTASPANILALLAERDADKKRIGETEEVLCKLLPGVQYMDPPDGGQVEPIAQVVRMVEDYRQRIAELEARTVRVPTFEEYQPDVARELQGAFRIACAAAGIKLEVGE